MLAAPGCRRTRNEVGVKAGFAPCREDSGAAGAEAVGAAATAAAAGTLVAGGFRSPSGSSPISAATGRMGGAPP